MKTADGQSHVPANLGDTLIRVEGVSKKFCRSLKQSLWYGVLDVADELNPFSGDSSKRLTQELRDGEFWAVDGVSFELNRGECIGLIGHNGAGKTTLLRMINGLIKPDKGRIQIRGNVGALIALGTGFNPVLSGRDNIYVNGAILGLTKRQIDERLSDIIDFAEIGDFIESPVQSYSSGMQVRLGFAVATAMQPDVLLLDEILSVGDAAFRHKCYHRIHSIIKNCAVIFVSHSMDSISAICSSVGFMDRGKFTYYRQIPEGIEAYNRAMANKQGVDELDSDRIFQVYPPIVGAEVTIETPEVNYGGELRVSVSLELTENLENIVFSFSAINSSEQMVMNWNLSRSGRRVDLKAGRSVFRFSIPNLQLHDGTYRWALWIGRTAAIEANLYAMRAGKFRVTSPFVPLSGIPYLPKADEFELTHQGT